MTLGEHLEEEPMKRFFVALMAGAAVFAITFAAAASLDVNGGTIQYGEDTQLTCTSSANVQGWGYESDTGLVSFVRIAYNPLCAGNDMFVAIADSDSVERTGAALTNSGTVTINFTPLPAVTITDIHIAIEGSAGEANN
jgi:hypothetical protein